MITTCEIDFNSTNDADDNKLTASRINIGFLFSMVGTGICIERDEKEKRVRRVREEEGGGGDGGGSLLVVAGDRKEAGCGDSMQCEQHLERSDRTGVENGS